MENLKNLSIRIHGSGGGGVVTTAKIIAWAIIEGEGKSAQMFPSFGPERSGAPVIGFIRVGGRPSPKPMEDPDVIVVFDTAIDKDSTYAGLKDDSIVILDTPQSAVKMAEKIGRPVWCVDASTIAKDEIGKSVPGIALFGALVKAIDIISIKNMYASIDENVPKVALDGNIRAARRGYTEAQFSGKTDIVVRKDNELQKPGWPELIPGAVAINAGNSMEYHTGDWGTALPKIDSEKCKLCMICWVMCPEDVFQVVNGKLSLDALHCKGCGVCAEVCPETFNAITMVDKGGKE